ncbi:hypothetical protein H0O03_01040 [Candidatus Micrarchaeota archaeon]|nr:hypothetical protein [Candidatus Micrarchaeota archaeon]
MKRFLAALLAVLVLAQLAAADEVNYSFSTFGSVNSTLTRANTTVMFNYEVPKGSVNNISTDAEKLFFENGFARTNSFYLNEFSPVLNASVLEDKANKTYFYLRGKNYLLLDFNHAHQNVVFGKETYYAANVTYACNFTIGGYTFNVSKVYRNTTTLQPKKKIEFTFIGGGFINQSFEVEEGGFYKHWQTGLILSPLSIYSGVQDNLTNFSLSFFSFVYNVSGAGDYAAETVYGPNNSIIGISRLFWEPDGDFKGFGFNYDTVTGTGKEFNLSRDCIYTPQMVCNWNITRKIAAAATTPTNLTVNCPPWPEENDSNSTLPKGIRYCFNNSDCNFDIDSCTTFSCTGTGNETVNLTIGNYSGNTSKTCVYSRLTGCDYQSNCTNTGFRYADAYDYWYCQDNIFKKQKQGGASCSNSYECVSNSCSGSCSGYVTPTPPVFPSTPPTPTPSVSPTPTPTPVPECVYDGQCSDGLACTADYCVNNTCVRRTLYGCALGAECKEYGFVDIVNGAISYCSPDGTWSLQKATGESCRQNYECLSYACQDLLCRVPMAPPMQGVLEAVGDFLQSIIDFFLNLFK